MARPVTSPSPVAEALALSDQRGAFKDIVGQCRMLTSAIFDGLDLSREIEMVIERKLGDVVLLTEGSRVTGFAVCHAGKGSEAGSDAVYVKFAAIRPDSLAAARFPRLIEACNDFAHRCGAKTMSGGVNLARMNAYRALIDLGFRATLQGVAMHRPWVEAYDRPEIFVLEDWR